MSSLGPAPREFRSDDPDLTNLSAEFEIWLEDLESYFTLQNVTEAQQKVLLLNLGGRSIRKIVKGLPVVTPSAPATVFTVLRDALKKYFKPSINPTVERHRFHQQRQLSSESLTAYAAALCSSAESCNFVDTSVDTVVNCQMRDQFTAGMASQDIRRQLLSFPDLMLQGALQKAVALELSFAESKLYDVPPQTGPSLPPMTVHRITTQYKPSPNTTQPKSSSTVQPPCKYCGGYYTPGMSHCAAAGK